MMNLGWIRHLFALSKLEKGRIQESAPDPRRIEAFQDIDTLIAASIAPEPPAVTPPPAALEPRASAIKAEPKLNPRRGGLPDQDLLKKLLKHRPQYQSSRILRAEKPAETLDHEAT